MKIKVVMCEPEKLAKIVEIEASLKNYQSIVDGYIEAIYPFEDNVAIVCNDEGKFNGSMLNRALRNEGEIYDILAGTFFICGLTEDNFGSLTDAQAKKYKRMFRYPEVIFNTHEGLVALPYIPEE